MESLTDRNLIDGNARRRIFYRSLKIGFLSRDWLCFGNIKESFSKVFKNFSALTMPQLENSQSLVIDAFE